MHWMWKEDADMDVAELKGELKRSSEEFSAHFDYDAETHTYTDKNTGEVVPSVTDIMWPISFQALASVPPSVLARAAEKGTKVHNAIHLYTTTGYDSFDETTQKYFAQYLKWAKEFASGKVFLASEYRTWENNGLGAYCGTIDQLWYDTETAQVWVVDFKTSSKASRDSWMLQGFLYAEAMNGLVANCDVASIRVQIVHLTEKGFKVYNDGEDDFWLEEVGFALQTLENYFRRAK